MRQILPALVITVLPFSTVYAADNYSVDPDHTFATFTVNHLGMSDLTGRIDIKDGAMTLDQDTKTGTITVNLDPASIDTGHQKRDDHLRSPDFLNVVEFPDMSFESTSATLTDGGGTVEGNLTILGQSKPVTLTVTGWNCGDHPFNNKPMCGFNAEAAIKRSDWGVNYGIPALGDDMQLSLEIEAYKQ